MIRSIFVDNLQSGSRENYGILVNMNRVFEAAVERAARDAVRGAALSIEAQYRLNPLVTGGSPPINMKPDFVVSGPDGAIRLVGDAKWKTGRLTQSDVYQLTSYQPPTTSPGYSSILRKAVRSKRSTASTSDFPSTFENCRLIVRQRSSSRLPVDFRMHFVESSAGSVWGSMNLEANPPSRILIGWVTRLTYELWIWYVTCCYTSISRDASLRATGRWTRRPDLTVGGYRLVNALAPPAVPEQLNSAISTGEGVRITNTVVLLAQTMTRRKWDRHVAEGPSLPVEDHRDRLVHPTAGTDRLGSILVSPSSAEFRQFDRRMCRYLIRVQSRDDRAQWSVESFPSSPECESKFYRLNRLDHPTFCTRLERPR